MMSTEVTALGIGSHTDKLIAAELGYSNFKHSSLSGFTWADRTSTSNDHPFNVRDGKVNEPISEYSHDLDAAFSLPTGDEWFIRLNGPTSSEPNFVAFVMWRWAKECNEDDPDYPTVKAVASTGALAVCRAWLAWKLPRTYVVADDEGGAA